jgi:hypothetical protein
VSGIFRANKFIVYDSTDATKRLVLDLSAILTSTTRTAEFLDANGAVLLQLESLQYVGRSSGIP